MPRIADDIVDCAIYLYHSRENAAAGVRAGGSGFLLGVPSGTPEPLRPLPERIMKFHLSGVSWHTPHAYAVTCKHVIENGACTIRLNTAAGDIEILDTMPKDWYTHRTADLAIYPLRLRKTIHKFSTVHFLNIITEEIARELDVGIGDDLVTVGRFLNAEGYQKNAPVVRFGHIAAMPGEPIEMEFDGKRTRQLSYLAEMRTLSGYSGSPVFLRIPHWELLYGADGKRWLLTKAVEAPPKDSATVFRLLGIGWGYIPEQPLKIFRENQKGGEDEEVKRLKTSGANSGMMGIVPAWKLLDVLNRKKLALLRKLAEKELKKGAPGVGC